MIYSKHLYFAYSEGRRKQPALVDFSFTLKPGEFVCLMGSNGSGKSTVAKIFKRLLTADSGELMFEDISAYSEDGRRYAREKIGYVFESPDSQIVSTLVEEDMLFGLKNLGVSEDAALHRIEEVENILSIKDLRKKTVDELSSGEKQRVVLAGVLVMKPIYLFSDESTAWLDVSSRIQVIEIFKRLASEGMGIVHITHDPLEAVQADRVVVLDKGHVVREGPPEVVFSSSYSLLKIGIRVPLSALVSEALKGAGIDIVHSALITEDVTS